MVFLKHSEKGLRFIYNELNQHIKYGKKTPKLVIHPISRTVCRKMYIKIVTYDIVIMSNKGEYKSTYTT